MNRDLQKKFNFHKYQYHHVDHLGEISLTSSMRVIAALDEDNGCKVLLTTSMNSHQPLGMLTKQVVFCLENTEQVSLKHKQNKKTKTQPKNANYMFETPTLCVYHANIQSVICVSVSNIELLSIDIT